MREVIGAAARHATAEAPLAWLAMEAGSRPDRADVTVRTWPGGALRLVARAGFHGSPVEWLASERFGAAHRR